MAIIHLTNENFEQEVMTSEIPVLIDFYADWCGPCKMLGPIIAQIAEEVTDKKICKVNVDEAVELATRFGVSSIPTLVLIKKGEVAAKAVGARSKKSLLEFLES